MVCAACGQQMNTEARFCCHCGRPMPMPVAQQQQQQQQGWNFNFGAGRLVRPRFGRMLGGVCAGLAEHLGWDVTAVRLLTVLVFFLGCGSLLIGYVVAWIVIPNEPYFYMPPTYGGPTGYPETAPRSTYDRPAGSAPIS